MSSPAREEQIFEGARALKDRVERKTYLDAACAGDPALRRNVEALLAADAGAGTFFADGAAALNQSALDLATTEQPGDHIGRYKLLQKIGEGGCGVVFMAEQDQPIRRKVALKVIKLGMDTKSVIARFEAERQALALMEHPNIARVFDAGATATGRPYFVMELVRGVRITDYCDQHKLPTHARLDLFAQVCHAIQHAHQKGIIHRDIKPSNILVTLHDGVPVPKVIDFGIAKATTDQQLTDKTLFTAFEQFMGTPAYMSPEQAEMSGLDIDTRSDIYSLGVLLYELLTGKTPFDGKELLAVGLDAMRRTIREKEPVRPSTRLQTMLGTDATEIANHRQTEPGKLTTLLRGDLDWIVMKCLEKDRRRRYETATDLAADLKRHLNNEPVVARPPSTAYQFQKLLRRNKVMSVATAVVLTVILVGTGISITQTLRAQRELGRALAAESQAQREKANAQAAERIAKAARQQETGLRVRAEAAERATEQQLYTALLEQARATVLSGELGQRVRTLDALQRASAISNTVELRREAFAALGLVDLRFERALPTGPDCTMAVLDPRFERFAVGRGTNAVEIRAVSDQRLLASLSLNTGPELAEAGQWSADGRFLAVRRWPRSRTSTSFARVEIWEAGTGRNVLSLPPTAWGAFSFHPSLPRILAADTADTVSVWDLEHGGKLTGFSVTGIVHHVEFSPDGSSFVVQHRIEKPWFTSFYDAVGGILRTSVITGWINGMAWDPQDRWIAFAAREGDVTLYDRKQDTIRLLGRHRNGARTAMFNPAGDLLFTGGGEQEIVCWDLHLWQPVLTVRHRSTQLQFRADGEQCALITRNALQLCTLERPAACRELAVDLGGSLQHAAISPDGRWLAVSGLLRLGLWDLTREAPPAVPFEDENPASFFSPDSTELFAFSRDKFSRWRIHSVSNDFAPPDLAPLAVPRTGRVYSGHFTSNSLMLGTQDGMLVAPRADITSNVIQHVQVGYARGQLSPDGVWMAVRKRRVMLMYPVHPWIQATNVGFNREELLGHVFTPDGTELAVATPTGVTFLNTNRWQPQRKLSLPLDGTTQGIFKWNFMPDGSAFWLAYDARTAALHDARTFETLLPLPAGTIPLAVSPNGRHLVVSVDAQRLQVWDLIEVRNQLRALGLDWTGNRMDSRVAER